MKFKKIWIIWVILGLIIQSAFASENKAIISYLSPLDENETAVQKKIQASGIVELTIEFINTTFILPRPLTFIMGGEDGPLYDGDTGQIITPYSFIQEVEERFSTIDYSQTGITAEQATMDALMHTLFHELAHALIHINDIPIVGKEEDAADGLASVLLIELFEDGARWH